MKNIIISALLGFLLVGCGSTEPTPEEQKVAEQQEAMASLTALSNYFNEMSVTSDHNNNYTVVAKKCFGKDKAFTPEAIIEAGVPCFREISGLHGKDSELRKGGTLAKEFRIVNLYF